jgi:hypothetical protein
VAILAAFQAGVILAWAGYHEHVRATAPTFRIPLHPVDPFDVLRGRYFTLNPLDGTLKTGRPDTVLTPEAIEAFLPQGQREYYGFALIGFCPVGEVRRVCALRQPGVLYREAGPAGTLWAHGHAIVRWEDAAGGNTPEPGWRVTLDLQLDRFFLPNKIQLPGRENESGWELEVSHRPDRPLLPLRLWFKGQPFQTGD